MLRQTAVALPNLPGDLVDVDVAGDDWVGVCAVGGRQRIVTPAGSFDVAAVAQFPIVRIVGPDRVILVDSRTTAHRANAWLYDHSGALINTFMIGDGVQDVLVAGARIIATYFDEGVFSGMPLPAEGVCVFALNGELELGYRTGVKDAVDIVDCYCACLAGPDELCFSPYTGFPLVRLNLTTQNQHVDALPPELAGAGALATDGRVFFFYSPYQQKHTVFSWSLGGPAQSIGTHAGPLRGSGRAQFIAKGLAGYTIVDAQPA